MNLHPRSLRRGALIGMALTGAVLVPAAAAAAKTTKVTCKGGDQSCTAVVSLAGGASDDRLQVALPGTNLKLVSTSARPHWIHGAYALSRGKYTRGGSRYTATLNAVQSIPKGGRLTLLFEAPLRSRACKSTTPKDIADLSISKLGSSPANGVFSCQQANAVGQTWALRFDAGESVRAFSVNDVEYRCKLVPVVPQNFRCDGGGTRVRFAAPTGH